MVDGSITLPDGTVISVAQNASLFVNGTLTLGDGSVVRVIVTDRGVTIIPLFNATDGINGTVLIDADTDGLDLRECENVQAGSSNNGREISAVITIDDSECGGGSNDNTALIVGIVVPIVCVCCCCLLIIVLVTVVAIAIPRSSKLFAARAEDDDVNSRGSKRDSVGWDEGARAAEVRWLCTMASHDGFRSIERADHGKNFCLLRLLICASFSGAA